LSPKLEDGTLRVLKAISSEIRLSILRALYRERLLSFTEICDELRSNFNIKLESSRIAYHLTKLRELNLITIDEGTGKYRLSERGLKAVRVAMELMDYLGGEEKLAVRDDKLIIREFDRSFLINYLKNKVGVPLPQAFFLSKYVEERVRSTESMLVDSEYLRYLIGASMYERGLNEYERYFRKLGVSYISLRELIEESLKGGPHPLTYLAFSTLSLAMKQYPYLSGLLDGRALKHYGRGRLYVSNLHFLGLIPESLLIDIKSCGLRRGTPSEVLLKVYELSLRASQYSSYSHIIHGFEEVLNYLSEKCSKRSFLIYLNRYLRLLTISPSLTRNNYTVALSVDLNEVPPFPHVHSLLVAATSLAEEGITSLPVLILKLSDLSKITEELIKSVKRAIIKGVPLFIANSSKVKGLLTAYLREVPPEPKAKVYALSSTVVLNALETLKYFRKGELMEVLNEPLMCGMDLLERVNRKLKEVVIPSLSSLIKVKEVGVPVYGYVSTLGLEEAISKITDIDEEKLRLLKEVLKGIKEVTSSKDIKACSITPDLGVYEYLMKFSKGLEEVRSVSPIGLIPLSRPLTLEDRASLESKLQDLAGPSFLNVHLTSPFPSPEELKDILHYLLKIKGLRALTFTVDITKCLRCGLLVRSLLNKCPRCSSGGDYVNYFGKVIAKYENLDRLSVGAKAEYFSRIRYSSPLIPGSIKG